MKNVEQILFKMLPGKEERDTYLVFYLQSKWQDICGSNVARHSKPVHLENKVLYINTDSSVWSNHLLLMKKQFLKNINGVLNKRTVNDLKFFNGSVENSFLNKPAATDKQDKIELKDEERQSIAILAAGIKNTDLQRKIMAFKAAAVKRDKFLLKKGAQKCRRCGAVINGSGSLCSVCARYEREKLHDEVVRFLLTEPWSDYENCKKALNCDKILYDSVKKHLQQHYYGKVAAETASDGEKMLAVIFKTGKTPDLIDDKTYQNVLTNLRGK